MCISDPKIKNMLSRVSVLESEKLVESHALFSSSDISIAINDMIANAVDGDVIKLGMGVWQSKKIVIANNKKFHLELMGEIELVTDNILFEIVCGGQSYQKYTLQALKTSVSNATCFCLRNHGEANFDFETCIGFRYGIAMAPNASFFGVKGSCTSGSPTLTVDNSDDISIGRRLTIDGVSGVFVVSNKVGTTLTLDKNVGATVVNSPVRHAYHIATGSVTSGSATLTVNDGSRFVETQKIAISGVTGTKIIQTIVGNTITLTTTAGATVTNAFIYDTLATTSAGSADVVVSDASHYRPGCTFTIDGITGTKIVKSINGNTITMTGTTGVVVTNSAIRPSFQYVQYDHFTFKNLFSSEANILFETNGDYLDWTNENRFFNGRLGDFSRTGKYGIYFTKPLPTAPSFIYDNNKFYNVGLEGLSVDGAKLSKTSGTMFVGCRTGEGVTGYFYNEDDTCTDTNIIQANQLVSSQVRLLGKGTKLSAPLVDGNGVRIVKEIENNILDQYVMTCHEGLLAGITGSITSGTKALTVNETANLVVGMTIVIDPLSAAPGTFTIATIASNTSVTTNESAGATFSNKPIYGTLPATTGSITAGSNQLTVSTSTHLRPYMGISVAGMTGIKKILSKNVNTLTLDSVSDATVSNGAVKAYTPDSGNISQLGITVIPKEGYTVMACSDASGITQYKYSTTVKNYLEIEGVLGMYEVSGVSGNNITLALPLKAISFTNRSMRLSPKATTSISYRLVSSATPVTLNEYDELILIDSTNGGLSLANNTTIIIPTEMNVEGKEILINLFTYSNQIVFLNYKGNTAILPSKIEAQTTKRGMYLIKFALGRWTIVKTSADCMFY